MRRTSYDWFLLAEPVPVKITENLYEIQRPRASVDMMQRQNSFRGFSKLAETSPFKRQMSLRLDELSATTDRLKRFVEEDGLATTASTAHSAQHAASEFFSVSWDYIWCGDWKALLRPSIFICIILLLIPWLRLLQMWSLCCMDCCCGWRKLDFTCSVPLSCCSIVMLCRFAKCCF